jgi:hypothetical protein
MLIIIIFLVVVAISLFSFTLTIIFNRKFHFNIFILSPQNSSFSEYFENGKNLLLLLKFLNEKNQNKKITEGGNFLFTLVTGWYIKINFTMLSDELFEIF